MEIPLIIMVRIYKINAFTTNENNPSVSKFIGRLIIESIGLSVKNNNAKNVPPISKVKNPPEI
jgi:hypothetical protein